MLIGLDIGTTNVKAVAVRDDDTVLTSAVRSNHILTPQPGRSEQDPESVFQNVLAVLGEVMAAISSGRSREPLHGIVFSSAMHGLLAADRAGKPLTNIWLWSDLRADDMARQIRQNPDGPALYHRTGVPIHAMSPLIKIIWLKHQLPDVFQSTHKFLGIKEFVWQRLTGSCESDLSVASATGLLDIRKNRWDETALQLAGISADRLPDLVSPRHIGYAIPGSDPFLPATLPLIIGASDGALANSGSGAVLPGQFAVTIGTSAAIRTVVNNPVTDEQMRTFCYRIDESRLIAGGASNNGTNALEWLRTAVFQSPLDAGNFAAQASQAPPGSDGLLFFPYLLGERAPLYDAHASATFRGLNAAHGQSHFVRAVMEGVLFNLKHIAEALEERHPIRTLHAGGGFSHNNLWVQMLADIFQKTVLLVDERIDVSARGAVLWGRTVLNLPQYSDNQEGRVVEPDEKKARGYVEMYKRFRE